MVLMKGRLRVEGSCVERLHGRLSHVLEHRKLEAAVTNIHCQAAVCLDVARSCLLSFNFQDEVSTIELR